MSRILVTGANGQLGSELRVLAGQDSHFVFTDLPELDITDKEAVSLFVEENQIGLIINCAAYTAVDKAEDDELLADKINHKAVRYLAEVAAKKGIRLIHISTDYVFDGTANIPYKEDDKTAPLGVYGRTKRKGEEAVLASGCHYMILRTSWLYSSFGSNFVKTMLRLTAERERLNVVFDQIGTPTYAADLAEVIYKIAIGRLPFESGLFHFSNEGVCSWFDFAVTIAQISGNDKCRIEPCHSNEFPAKVKRPHYSVLDKTQIKKTLGLTIPYWRKSLEACLNILNK